MKLARREGLDRTLSMENSPKGGAFLLERGKTGEKGGGEEAALAAMAKEGGA